MYIYIYIYMYICMYICVYIYIYIYIYAILVGHLTGGMTVSPNLRDSAQSFRKRCMYVSWYWCSLSLYIYIYRERERERECATAHLGVATCATDLPRPCGLAAYFRQVCGGSSRLAAWDWLLGFSLAVRPVEGIILEPGAAESRRPVGFQGGDPSADLRWRLLSNPLSCGRGRDRTQGLPDARAWSCQLSYDCS